MHHTYCRLCKIAELFTADKEGQWSDTVFMLTMQKVHIILRTAKGLQSARFDISPASKFTATSITYVSKKKTADYNSGSTQSGREKWQV